MNLPTNLENYMITERVQMELTRSIRKYDWSQYSYWRMVYVILVELWELAWAIAFNDLHGAHGVYAEAAQISACAQKMMLEILRRKKGERSEHA